MKKTIRFIIILLFPGFAMAQTSEYHQFPDSSAYWLYNYQRLCVGTGIGEENYTITFTGDTLIGTETYRKLAISGIQDLSVEDCGGQDIGYQGAIREDTVAQMVYFIPASAEDEVLLYDFTLEVGDTVEGYLASYGDLPLIVEEIDSVMVGNSYRTRWNFNGDYGVEWIEGIGSSYGLLQASPGDLEGQAYYTFICFNDLGNTLQYPFDEDCFLITDTDNQEAIEASLNLYPNPTAGDYTLSYTLPQSASVRIEIMDITGKRVVELNKGKQSVGNHVHEANISELPTGLYLCNLYVDGERLSKRLVKR